MADFFIADTHFFDERIIGYSKRPFETVNEMNEFMVRAWNGKIKSKCDRVFIMGDFALTTDTKSVIQILKRLNGRKILITGNHDKTYMRGKDIAAHFEMVRHYHVARIGDIYFVLFHFPMIEWERQAHGSIHVHGHIHANPTPFVDEIRNSINTSADVIGLAPLSMDELMERVQIKNAKIDEQNPLTEKSPA